MNKIKFYEALYTSCSYIVARRKSIVLPILIIVAGIVLPLASTMLLKGSEFDNINSAVILLGIALAIGGAIWLLGRVNGKGEPFHTVKGKFLVTKTLSYDRSRRSEVLKAMGSGNLEALLAVPTCEVSALCLLLTMLDDKSFAAAQLFEYAELEYRELSRVTVIKG